MAEYRWLKDTFKVVSTIYSSNWNSINPGFHYATHLVWLQEWHVLQYKGLWLQETYMALAFWMYMQAQIQEFSTVHDYYVVGV
jgi:hypothetical protein